MFCVVRLKFSKEILVINKTWIRGFNDIKCRNLGIKRNKNQTIFYSNDGEGEVDFGLPLSQLFQPYVQSLYEAQLLKFYGMGSHFFSYVTKKKKYFA